MRLGVIAVVCLMSSLCLADIWPDGAECVRAREVFGIAIDEPMPKYSEPKCTDGMVRVDVRDSEVWLKCFGPFIPHSVDERSDSAGTDLFGELLVGRVEGLTKPIGAVEAQKIFKRTCACFDKARNLMRGGRYDFDKWGECSASWIGFEDNGVPFIIELDCNAAVKGEYPCPASLSISEFEQLRGCFKAPDLDCFGVELGSAASELEGLKGVRFKVGTNCVDVTAIPGIQGRWHASVVEILNGRIVAVEGCPKSDCGPRESALSVQTRLMRDEFNRLSPKLGGRFKGAEAGRWSSAEYMSRSGHICRIRMTPVKGEGTNASVRVRFEDLTPARPPFVAKGRHERLKKAKADKLAAWKEMMAGSKYQGQWEGNVNGRMWLIFDPDGYGMMRIGLALVWFRWTSDHKGNIACTVPFDDGTSFGFSVRYLKTLNAMMVDMQSPHLSALAKEGDGRGQSTYGGLAFKAHLRTTDMIEGPRPENPQNSAIDTLKDIKPAKATDNIRKIESWEKFADVIESLDGNARCSICSEALPFVDFGCPMPGNIDMFYVYEVSSAEVMTLPTRTVGGREWPDWDAVKGKSLPGQEVKRAMKKMKSLGCRAHSVKTDGESQLKGYMVSGPCSAFTGEHLADVLGREVSLPLTVILAE